MSSIDLVILGIVLEKPQSAYDIQKDVEYHHFSRWTKISVPSIYRKVLQLSEKGYLQSDIVKPSTEEDNMKIEWILCPFCGSKTRLKIRDDTVLENFPLYCPKCKYETLITVRKLNLSIVQEPDAQTQSR